MILSVVSPGCAPSASRCAELVPANAAQVRPGTTPDGASACLARVGDVRVIVEVQRNGLSWGPGRTWVDGHVVPEDRVVLAIEEAKGRIAAEKLGSRAKGFIEGAASTLTGQQGQR